MIDWYVNDRWGWRRKRDDILTLVFLGRWLGSLSSAEAGSFVRTFAEKVSAGVKVGGRRRRGAAWIFRFTRLHLVRTAEI